MMPFGRHVAAPLILLISCLFFTPIPGTFGLTGGTGGPPPPPHHNKVVFTGAVSGNNIEGLSGSKDTKTYQIAHFALSLDFVAPTGFHTTGNYTWKHDYVLHPNSYLVGQLVVDRSKVNTSTADGYAYETGIHEATCTVELEEVATSLFSNVDVTGTCCVVADPSV